MKATIKPENSTNQKLTWTSSNFNIVTVKKVANSETTATITAKSVGTAEITVTASNGIQATCEVNVKPLLPTKITLPSTKTIIVGENQQLNPIITPKNADETRITWSSSNKNIVRVTSFGVIHGGKEGTATITARTENGKIAKCKVTVKKNDISIKNIRINKTSLEITKGNTSNLKAIITPSNATIKKLTWTSSNTKIVTVKKDANSEKTATITAKAVGTAKITVTADGGKTATCIVKVINSSNPSNPTDPSTPSSEDTQKLVESLKYACKFIGKIKYRKGAGGKLENGYSDCSHYVHRVFEHTGVMNKFVKSLKWGYHGCPNTTDVAHFNKGEKWDYSNASPGDVIWEHYSNSSNHVYIYLGNNKRLGCSANHGVRIAEAHKNGQTKYERKIIHFNIFPKAPNSYYDPSTKTIKYK